MLFAKFGFLLWTAATSNRILPWLVTTGRANSAVFSLGLRKCNSVGLIFISKCAISSNYMHLNSFSLQGTDLEMINYLIIYKPQRMVNGFMIYR